MGHCTCVFPIKGCSRREDLGTGRSHQCPSVLLSQAANVVWYFQVPLGSWMKLWQTKNVYMWLLTESPHLHSPIYLGWVWVRGEESSPVSSVLPVHDLIYRAKGKAIERNRKQVGSTFWLLTDVSCLTLNRMYSRRLNRFAYILRYSRNWEFGT